MLLWVVAARFDKTDSFREVKCLQRFSKILWFSILALLKEMRDAESVQDFILLLWCESGKLGSRGSPRFPCVTPVVESFSSDFLRTLISYWAKSH